MPNTWGITRISQNKMAASRSKRFSGNRVICIAVCMASRVLRNKWTKNFQYYVYNTLQTHWALNLISKHIERYITVCEQCKPYLACKRWGSNNREEIALLTTNTQTHIHTHTRTCKYTTKSIITNNISRNRVSNSGTLARILWYSGRYLPAWRIIQTGIRSGDTHADPWASAARSKISFRSAGNFELRLEAIVVTGVHITGGLIVLRCFGVVSLGLWSAIILFYGNRDLVSPKPPNKKKTNSVTTTTKWRLQTLTRAFLSSANIWCRLIWL